LQELHQHLVKELQGHSLQVDIASYDFLEESSVAETKVEVVAAVVKVFALHQDVGLARLVELEEHKNLASMHLLAAYQG
jgi:hypothetical protein